MTIPYTSQAISNYNATPPEDDGSQTSSNEIEWAKHIDKIGDPLKTLAEAINTELVSAFGKVFCGSVSTHAVDYTVVAGDRGKLLVVTGTTTITLVAAATATAGYVLGVYNGGAGVVTLDGSGAETINGAATVAVNPGYLALLICDGASWYAMLPNIAHDHTESGSLQIPTAGIEDDAITAVKIAANAVGSSEIATNAVDASEIASGAIHQAELNTSLQQNSASRSTGSYYHVTLTGGEYSLNALWAFDTTTGRGTRASYFTTSYATVETAQADGDNGTFYFQSRYINSSYPYDMGDGFCHDFIYLLVDTSSGNVIGYDIASAPPWVYNGPTKTTADSYGKDGKQYIKRLIIPDQIKNMPRNNVQQIIAHRKAFAEYKKTSEYEFIELTPEMKNADWDIIPTPWPVIDSGVIPVLLDPISDIAHQLSVLREDGRGEDIGANIITSGYINIGNTPLQRRGPNGLMIVDASWKNNGI